MLLAAGHRPTIAPLYDVMCADPYVQVTRNLAQTIAGRNRGDHLKRRHWRRFAAAAGLGPSLTSRGTRALAPMVMRIVEAARAEVEAMIARGDACPPEIERAVEARCRAILDGPEDRSGADHQLHAW